MWLVSFQGLNVPFLPFDINPSYEGLLTFWTYVIILQVSVFFFIILNFCPIKLFICFYFNNIGYDSSIALCYNRTK